MNSVAWLHFSWVLFLEQWSMVEPCYTVHGSKLMNSGAWLHYSDQTSPVQCYALNRVRPNKIKKILLIYIFVINFLQFLIQLPFYWLFGIVVAGEVHPQPQLLLFGKAGKTHFYWWDPLPTVAQPPICKKQHRCCFLC